jgi:tungstate transport system ATP-binding protein
MSILTIKDLEVRRRENVVLRVDKLAVEKGQILAVIGPNGAGKSTLLLSVSRLIKPAAGQIHFDGQDILSMNLLEYRRRIALVLQDPLLLYASVQDNVAAGLYFRHIPKKEIAVRVDEWLEKLGISHLRKRHSRQLSGGEAQRISLARAFALQPELLLLDEPFGALDAPTRARLLDDLQGLLAATGTTTIFVTHDLNEALVLGQRVAVLLDGRLRQVGSPQEVFNSPADPAVAAFVGVEMIIPARVVTCQDGLVTATADGCLLEAVGETAAGREVYLCLRPEDVTLWPATPGMPSSARNWLDGRIVRLGRQGPLVRVMVDCGFPLVALVTRSSAEGLELREGLPVRASFKASAVHLIQR